MVIVPGGYVSNAVYLYSDLDHIINANPNIQK